jgi:hypothetical protein
MLLIVLLDPLLGLLLVCAVPDECAKCAVVERHVHMEGHLGNPAEPRGIHDVVAQDDLVAAELLRWLSTLHLAVGVIHRQSEPGRAPRDSRDDLDLATDVRLLSNDVA